MHFTNILSKYDIHLEPNNLDLYQNSFIHKSYTKKDPNNYPNEVEISPAIPGFVEEHFESDSITLNTSLPPL